MMARGLSSRVRTIGYATAIVAYLVAMPFLARYGAAYQEPLREMILIGLSLVPVFLGFQLSDALRDMRSRPASRGETH